MEYRILGPLEVVQDGTPVDLGSPKQRAVLAALVLESGRVVAAERLIDQVWGDDAPANVTASLQAYVSNLRRLLRDDSVTSPIVRQAPGYRLDISADRIDAQRFVAGADAAHSAVEARDWPGAVAAAQDALDLWRGDPLADLADEEWVRVAAVALQERRTECTEDLVTALLGTGRTAQALVLARTAYAAQPLRGRACWLYLVALHQDGRTTEALDELRDHIRRLDDELGLEPEPALRELQSAMLRHDPELAAWPGPASATVSDVVPAGTDTEPEAAGPIGAGAPDVTDPPTANVPHTALVGRAAEITVLDSVVDEVVAGGTRWLTLNGPAGIGKTRLAEEAMARAASRGARVLRAACPDDEGVPPWWPVSQLVRVLDADPDVVLAQDPDAEADRARFAVYERVRGLLADAAQDTPLAVLVDDVQWADPSSLGLFAHLAFALDGVPVLLVLTARSGVTSSDLRRLFDATSRRPGARHVTVPPMGGAEVGELVRRVSGEDVSRDETALLLTRTGGNPFFVSEYARLPRAEREAGDIPLAVRSVLGRRLEALDAATLQIMRTAAVIGDVLDIGLLQSVTRLDVDELADLLDEAADERIVVIAPGSRSYTFAHGLLRDELLAGMTDARRQRLHARVAAAVGSGRTTEDLSRRAGHLIAALPLADPEEVLQACRDAALDAAERWQTDSAAHWWEAATAAFDQLPVGRRNPDERDELVRLQLNALIRSGRGQTVYDLVDSEIRDAVAAGRLRSVGLLCSVLTRSAGAWPWAAFGENPGPLLATLQAAEPAMHDDPAAHARLLATLAIGSCYDPDGAVPDRLSRSAIDLAEQLGDPDVLADTLLGRCLTFSGVAARVHECAALLDRLAALPHESADIDEVLRHGIMTMVSATLGDMAAAAEHCRLGSAGSDALRLPVSRVQFRLTESLLAIWAGRFEEAETLFRDGVRLREQTELYFGWARMGIVVSRWKQGRVLSLLDEPSGETNLVEEACVAVARGDLEAADRLVGGSLDQDGPVIWTSHGNWALLGETVADAGLRRHAPRLIDLLQPLAGFVAIIGQLTAVTPVSLALARLYHLLGDDDAARRELASALELSERSGGVPSALRCRLFAFELDGASEDEFDELVAEADAAGLHHVARRAQALSSAGA